METLRVAGFLILRLPTGALKRHIDEALQGFENSWRVGIGLLDFPTRPEVKSFDFFKCLAGGFSEPAVSTTQRTLELGWATPLPD
jgi:hypothetical protein